VLVLLTGVSTVLLDSYIAVNQLDVSFCIVVSFCIATTMTAVTISSALYKELHVFCCKHLIYSNRISFFFLSLFLLFFVFFLYINSTWYPTLEQSSVAENICNLPPPPSLSSAASTKISETLDDSTSCYGNKWLSHVLNHIVFQHFVLIHRFLLFCY